MLKIGVIKIEDRVRTYTKLWAFLGLVGLGELSHGMYVDLSTRERD